MKVKELKALLADADDNDEVVLSKDAEGNRYSPLSNCWQATYVPNSAWSGNVYIRELSIQDLEEGCSEEDLYDGDDGQPALVLMPT